MNTLPDVSVQEFAHDQIASIVDLHIRVFSDYFLTHLGPEMLQLFYGEFINQNGNYGFVALSDDKVIGFVACTANADVLYTRLYKQYFWKLIRIVAVRLLRDAYIRKNVWDRMIHLRHAIKSLFLKSGTAPDARNGSSVSTTSIPTRLLSIGVDPNLRGLGVAAALVRKLCLQLEQDGIRSVGLSVNADNERAIAFYKKDGWIIESVNERTIRFWRATHTY